ncbi:MAG TPA: DUF6628 family protein [Sphingomonas sp.]|nr:DUF6628 family protein [Sphingomonas sp.]
MRPNVPHSELLPNAAPLSPYRRLLLYALRRMAAGGITDAHAAHAIFTGFGLGYRRPLILLRTLMAEISRVSAIRLTVAPCCCPRMTHDETLLLDAIAGAGLHAATVHEALRGLLRVRTCLGVLASAQAVAAAFSDAGMPLAGDCK